jgi:hypothetical protein
MIALVVPDEHVSDVVDAIVDATYADADGDARIVVTPVETTIGFRTKPREPHTTGPRRLARVQRDFVATPAAPSSRR